MENLLKDTVIQLLVKTLLSLSFSLTGCKSKYFMENPQTFHQKNFVECAIICIFVRQFD